MKSKFILALHLMPLQWGAFCTIFAIPRFIVQNGAIGRCALKIPTIEERLAFCVSKTETLAVSDSKSVFTQNSDHSRITRITQQRAYDAITGKNTLQKEPLIRNTTETLTTEKTDR
jgi:hypothetical protein